MCLLLLCGMDMACMYICMLYAVTEVSNACTDFTYKCVYFLYICLYMYIYILYSITCYTMAARNSRIQAFQICFILVT